jgi:hypothetical protein
MAFHTVLFSPCLSRERLSALRVLKAFILTRSVGHEERFFVLLTTIAHAKLFTPEFPNTISQLLVMLEVLMLEVLMDTPLSA